jgi:hypothetical protein
MRIGAGIFLFAVGAILRFALGPVSAHGFNIHVIGVILMAAGAVGALLTLWLERVRRAPGRLVRVAPTPVQPVRADEPYLQQPRPNFVEERRVYQDPPPTLVQQPRIYQDPPQ